MKKILNNKSSEGTSLLKRPTDEAQQSVKLAESVLGLDKRKEAEDSSTVMCSVRDICTVQYSVKLRFIHSAAQSTVYRAVNCTLYSVVHYTGECSAMC